MKEGAKGKGKVGLCLQAGMGNVSPCLLQPHQSEIPIGWLLQGDPACLWLQQASERLLLGPDRGLPAPEISPAGPPLRFIPSCSPMGSSDRAPWPLAWRLVNPAPPVLRCHSLHPLRPPIVPD